MEILLSGYYKGNKETGIFYSLFKAPMFDETMIYGIMRDYGHHVDGTPMNSVTLICVDDGTVDSYATAFKVFRMFIDAD